MQRLNYLTMITAIRNCVEKECFSVGVFTKTLARKEGVLMDVMGSMDKSELESVLKSPKNKHDTIVTFKNGSYIKILGANTGARGYAFNSILYENGIDQELLECVIRPTEKGWIYERKGIVL